MDAVLQQEPDVCLSSEHLNDLFLKLFNNFFLKNSINDFTIFYNEPLKQDNCLANSDGDTTE